ncbi:MAG: phage tail length tape measure family protein [Rhizomicrobium sp.]
MSGAALTASLVLKGDASGIVGAANDGAASLDRLKTSAAGAGAAGAGMAAPYNAAAVAITEQAAASKAAASALTASGAAKVDEIARLTQLASASSATTASITALSAAHGKYNSTVNSARALLAAGAVSQADYEKAVAAASSQLALSTAIHSQAGGALAKEEGGAAALSAAQKELGEVTETTGRHAADMAIDVERLGAASGVGFVQARMFYDGFRSLGMLFETGTAQLAGYVAAFLLLIGASISYESVYQKLYQAAGQQNNQLGQTHEQYVQLAGDIETATGSTEREAAAMAAALVQSNVTTSAWSALSAAAEDLARTTGIDLAAAMQQLAKDEADPAQSAEQLATQLGLLNEQQVQNIKNLQAQGDLKDAQVAFAKAVGAAYSGATDNTSAWSKSLDLLETGFSNAAASLGKLNDEMARYMSWLPGGVTASPDNPNMPEPSQSAAQAQAQADAAQRNQLGVQANNILSGMNIEGQTTVTDSYNKEILLQKAFNEGLITEQQYTQALAALDKEQTDAINKGTAAKQKLDATDQAHLATIKHLIVAGPQQIALAQADVVALQAEANASDGTAESIKNLQDQYDVQKKIQPYITALTQLNELHAKGVVNQSAYTKMASALNSTMQQITVSAKAEIAAQEQLNAMQTIASKFQGLSAIQNSNVTQPTTDSAFIANTSTQIFNANAAALTEWVNQTRTAIDDWLVYNSDGSQQALQKWQTFRDQLGLIFNADMAKFYTDDLARRTDWAAGVQRGLNQLTSETANWAKTSQDLVTGLSSHFEDDLAQMVVTGQNTLQDFFTWFAEQLVKMMYQEYMATSMNAMFGWIVGGLGDLMGAGAGAGGGAGGGEGEIFGAGTMHDGGIVGRDASVVRSVPISVFDGAPRYHGGGWIQPGEVPIIAQAGERILTAVQMANLESALLMRPVALQGALASDKAPVTVNIHPAPGTTATAQQRRNSDGSFSIDVMVEQIDRSLAQRSRKGRSAFVQSLENTHGIKRTPIG